MLNRKIARQFFDYIIERQVIWYRKEVLKNKAPWTDDPVLQRYHFCNNYRELDKGTKHVIENVILNKKLKTLDKIFNIVYYRLFNVDYFFGGVIPSPFQVNRYNPVTAIKYMDYERKKKLLFKVAYMVSGHVVTSIRPKEKHVQIAYAMKNNIKYCKYIAKKLGKYHDLNDLWQDLKALDFLGNFIAYQVLLDMEYDFDMIRLPPDSFTHIGPGAIPSLERMFPNVDKNTCHEIECHEALAITLHGLQGEYLDDNWEEIRYRTPFYVGKYLSLNNIEHCLCEFRKYYNLSNGIKQRVRLYKGAS